MRRRGLGIALVLCAFAIALLGASAVRHDGGPTPDRGTAIHAVQADLVTTPAPPRPTEVLPTTVLVLLCSALLTLSRPQGPVSRARPPSLGLAHPRLLRWHASLHGAPPVGS